VFVPLYNKSFTGEPKNCGTAKRKKHLDVPQILDSITNFKMKPEVISKVKSGRSLCSNVLFMNTDPGNKPRSLNPTIHPPTLQRFTPMNRKRRGSPVSKMNIKPRHCNEIRNTLNLTLTKTRFLQLLISSVVNMYSEYTEPLREPFFFGNIKVSCSR
jgi:hypothetical protein